MTSDQSDDIDLQLRALQAIGTALCIVVMQMAESLPSGDDRVQRAIDSINDLDKVLEKWPS